MESNNTWRYSTGRSFFEVIIHEPDVLRGLSGICIGFERGNWRCERFSEYIFNYLPEFALNWQERQNFSDKTAVELLRRASKIIYQTEKYQKRGEFGELILLAVLEELFNTIPAIAKIYYKSSVNDTVKGFDAVHVVVADDTLELWLGEVKFYCDIKKAIYDVVKELEIHSGNGYLRNEFAFISNKIDKSWDHSEDLLKLLDPNTSLDEVFDRTCIPVLLTYDSSTTREYENLKEKYREIIEAEIRKYNDTFLKSNLPKDLKIHLILLPLKSKVELVERLQKRLEAWQSI